MHRQKTKYFLTIAYLSFLISIISLIVLFLLLVSANNIPHKSESESAGSKNVEIIDKKDLVKSDFTEWNNICDWELIVINNQNEVPPDYKLNLKEYNNVLIDARIRESLGDMINDAILQNIKLWVSSGYRSLEKQGELFSKKINEYKNKGYTDADSTNLAQGIIAKPGMSEHNIGIAVDLNGVKDDFCYSNEYQWLMENSQNYGFILRYDNNKQSITGKIYEPWHFRYVGKENAQKMKENDLCLEEYITFLCAEY